MTESTFDVIVVGNGALGHATARALVEADPSVRVGLVGPAARTGGASRAAGAMLGCFGEVTRRLLLSPVGHHKIQAAVDSTKLWPQWLESLNAEVGADERVDVVQGTFIINNTRGGRMDDLNYEAIRQALDKYDEPYEDVDPTSIAGLNPAIDCRPLRAMFLPREGAISSARLLAAYSTTVAKSTRIRYFDDTVDRLVTEAGRVVGLVTRGGTSLGAKEVLLAAGSRTQDLLDKMPDLAIRIPMLLHGGGCALLLDSQSCFGNYTAPLPDHVVRTPNRAFACGLHLVPRPGGMAYVGATNYLSRAPFEKLNVSDTYFLTECAMEQLSQDLVWSKIADTLVGNRPVAIDGCPLIGPTSVGGLWILTATYRDGLFLSPLLGRDMASRILGKTTTPHPFHPEREPITTVPRADIVDEVMLHAEAVIWEHRILNATKVGSHRWFPKWMRDGGFEEVYRRLDEYSRYVLPPELALPCLRAAELEYYGEYFAKVQAAWGKS